MAKHPVSLSIDILHSRAVIIMMVFALLVMLKLGADVLAPLAMAIFLVALAWPIKTWLNRHLPDSFSYIGSFIALTGVLAVFALSLYFSLGEVVEAAPQYKVEVNRFWRQTKNELAINGVDTTGKVQMEEVREIVETALMNFHESLLTLFLVIAYVMLALPEVTRWKSKFRICLGKERSEKILSASGQWGQSFQAYLRSMIICGILNAVTTYLTVFAFGLDLAFTLAVLAFFLNFIPVIGAVLTIVPATLLAIFQFDGTTMPLAILISLSFVHMFVGNILEPKIQGNMLAMSPLIVLISVSLWGFLWGIPGALLAAPLTHGIIIACKHYDRTRWIACLLSEHPARVSPAEEEAVPAS